MTKSDLMRKMHRAGLRLDDAALAALREMQAIRRMLGLPAWPWPIAKACR